MNSELLEVKTTTETREEAEELSRAMVDARLAACAQVSGPIQSTYWWNGVVEQSTEWLCVAKTTSANFPALETFIKQRHKYEVPEIVATPITQGSDDYLDWVRTQSSI